MFDPAPYQFLVRSELRELPPAGAPALTVTRADGYSLITGVVRDQTQLLQVVEWLGRRGIEIVSITPTAGQQRSP